MDVTQSRATMVNTQTGGVIEKMKLEEVARVKLTNGFSCVYFQFYYKDEYTALDGSIVKDLRPDTVHCLLIFYPTKTSRIRSNTGPGVHQVYAWLVQEDESLISPGTQYYPYYLKDLTNQFCKWHSSRTFSMWGENFTNLYLPAESNDLPGWLPALPYWLTGSNMEQLYGTVEVRQSSRIPWPQKDLIHVNVDLTANNGWVLDGKFTSSQILGFHPFIFILGGF